MHNPKTYNIRHLSRTFGISLKRVDAVLRLKGLENSWDKVRSCFSLLLLFAWLRIDLFALGMIHLGQI